MKTPFEATLTDPSAPSRGGGESLAGRQLAHFRLERLLGKGGMGEVYEATDTALDRRVAVKVLPAEVAASANLRERFLREARSQARLQHPNVCHIYYVGEQDGLLFFAMELIDGESLAERLQREGRVPPDQAVELVRMAALGLREAHAHGFTHRDVKPSNLMVDRGGTVKVVDFGLVKQTGVADGGTGEAPRSTEGTALVGTPLYMAPEQAAGDALDQRADIYALGATLHHLVSGAPPFAGDSALELASQHLSSPRPRLAAPGRSGRVLAPIDALVDSMMRKDPADRPAGYDELVAQLERLSPARTRLAGFWVRFFAACIDLLLVSLVMIPLSLVVTDNNGWVLALLLGAYAVITVGRWGQTVGKAALEIEVVRTDGGRTGFARALLRALHQLAPLVFFGALSWGVSAAGAAHWMVAVSEVLVMLAFLRLPAAVALAALWRPDKRTGWDRVAGTMVRYRRLG